MSHQVCLACTPLGEFCSGLSLCDTLSATLLNLLVGVASEVDQLLDLGGCYLWALVVNSHCRFCGYLLWVYPSSLTTHSHSSINTERNEDIHWLSNREYAHRNENKCLLWQLLTIKTNSIAIFVA